MAEYLDKVVDVTLSYGTVATSSQALNVPLFILAHHVQPSERVLTFSSANQLLQLGFSSTSNAYIMARNLFAGSSRPRKLLIYRQEVSKFIFDLSDWQPNTIYSITLREGRDYKEFVVNSGIEIKNLAETFFELVDNDSFWGSRVVYEVVGKELHITPNPERSLDVGTSSNIIKTVESDEFLDNSLLNIEEAGANYFWLATDKHDEYTILRLADFAENNDKIYVFSSSDEDIAKKVKYNTVQKLIDMGFRNTCFALYTEKAEKEFPEAGVIGAVCNTTAGTTTLHGKTLAGVSAMNRDLITELNIVEQNGNLYKIEHNQPFYRDGLMVNGDFLDTVFHALWSKITLSEALFRVIKTQSMQQKGIRYSNEGLLVVRQAIEDGWLNVGIENGTILNEVNVSPLTGEKEDLTPSLYIPNRADIPTADIARRLLDGIVAEYVYAGFIHYIRVRVNILIDR